MNRLNEKERDYIIQLVKKGKSLNYISKITGLGKSTLYYHYKKTFGKKYKDLKIEDDDDLFIGELVGLFVGDGYAFFDRKSYSYSIRFYFNNTEKEYVKELVKLFVKNFNKSPMVYRTKNVLIIKYLSKKLFNFLLNYVGWGVSINKAGQNKKSRTVFLKDREYSDRFKIGFLRGFVDSDGYISSKKIVLASASEIIMKQTESFFVDLNFKYFKLSFYPDKRSNRKGMWHIYNT
ncbi:MAG: hypothetical protein CMH62_01195 [Nanoarchaeota archaeon]|nr:hypothetical protein [Nanoarchaeota archaeon]